MIAYTVVTVPWQISRAEVYWRGLRISDTIEKKPGVPEKANTRLQTAVMASAKDGFPTTFQSETKRSLE